jgi:OFA family oxalate/formate antiporter-like MFS transporter
MIATFTLVLIPGGRLLKRFGPRTTAGFGAVLFAAGYLAASVSAGRYPLLLMSLGGLTGAGIGLVYLCPIVVGTRLFPKHRGLVTGLSVGGFGAGAVLWNAFLHALLDPAVYSIGTVFRLIALVAGGLALAASLLLGKALQPVPQAEELGVDPVRPPHPTGGSIRLFLGLFGGTFTGLLIVSHLTSMAMAAGLGESLRVYAIPVFALGNVSGRLVWGGIHDWLGSRRAILLSLSSQAAAVLLFAALFFSGIGSWILLLGIFLIGMGFGSCFVVFASATMERFGIDRFPILYPRIFLGYGAAALVGPLVGGWMVDRSGGYGLSVALALLVILSALLLASLRARRRGPRVS